MPLSHPTNSVNALNAFSTQYLSTINNSTTQTLTVCVQPRPLAVNTSLPAFAVLQPRATAACDQAVSKLLVYCCNGTDKPTDGRPTVHHCHRYLPNNTTVCTFAPIQFRRAGQQGPTRTLTAALKCLIKQLLGTYSTT